MIELKVGSRYKTRLGKTAAILSYDVPSVTFTYVIDNDNYLFKCNIYGECLNVEIDKQKYDLVEKI